MNLPENFVERVAQAAEKFYRVDALNCAQSVVKAMIQESGGTCTRDMVASATGFSHGFGGSGCCCGAFSGGVMAIGLLYGSELGGKVGSKKCRELTAKLYKAFTDVTRVTCCRVLHVKAKHGSAEQIDDCARRTAMGARLAAEIVMQAETSQAGELP